jgi:hypothetical protein
VNQLFIGRTFFLFLVCLIEANYYAIRTSAGAARLRRLGLDMRIYGGKTKDIAAKDRYSLLAKMPAIEALLSVVGSSRKHFPR